MQRVGHGERWRPEGEWGVSGNGEVWKSGIVEVARWMTGDGGMNR